MRAGAFQSVGTRDSRWWRLYSLIFVSRIRSSSAPGCFRATRINRRTPTDLGPIISSW
jgi:hypothetical protein